VCKIKVATPVDLLGQGVSGSGGLGKIMVVDSKLDEWFVVCAVFRNVECFNYFKKFQVFKFVFFKLCSHQKVTTRNFPPLNF
jgi:hypothetical protein